MEKNLNRKASEIESGDPLASPEKLFFALEELHEKEAEIVRKMQDLMLEAGYTKTMALTAIRVHGTQLREIRKEVDKILDQLRASADKYKVKEGTTVEEDIITERTEVEKSDSVDKDVVVQRAKERMDLWGIKQEKQTTEHKKYEPPRLPKGFEITEEDYNNTVNSHDPGGGDPTAGWG